MFDFFRSSEKTKKYGLSILLAVVALSMVTYLIPNTDLTSTTNTAQIVLADVGDQTVTALEARQAVDRMVANQQIPRDAAEVYFPQFVDQMVNERATIYQFEKMGLRVTDEEVLAGLAAVYPQLFQNGKLTSTDAFAQALASQGMSMQDGIETMRKALLLKKLQNLAYASVVVTPQEIDQAIIQRHRTAKIEYAAFSADKFRDRVNPTQADLKAEYEKNKAAYNIPAKQSYDVLIADRAKVEQSVSVPESQLRATYANSMDNFRTPERVRARHILVMTQGKPESEKNNLLKKAQDLLKQVKSGGDFAEIAKKNSDDPGSAARGGDLDFFVRGQMVPEFEKFAFSAKTNDISEIVTTQFGYHIIQVTEKQAPTVKPFDEVKESIAKQLKADIASELINRIGEQAREALMKPDAKPAEIAKQLNMELFSQKEVTVGQTTGGLVSSPELDAALAGLKPEGVSEVVIMPNDKLAVARMNGRIPARSAGFDEVQDRVRNAVVGTRARAMSLAAAQDVATKALAGGNLAELAKSHGIKPVTSGDVTLTDSLPDLGPVATLSDAYNKPVGTVIGPVPVQGSMVVYRIVAQSVVDPKNFAYERDAAVLEAKQTKARTMFDLMQDSLLQKVKADGKLRIYEDRVRDASNTFRATP